MAAGMEEAAGAVKAWEVVDQVGVERAATPLGSTAAAGLAMAAAAMAAGAARARPVLGWVEVVWASLSGFAL